MSIFPTTTKKDDVMKFLKSAKDRLENTSDKIAFNKIIILLLKQKYGLNELMAAIKSGSMNSSCVLMPMSYMDKEMQIPAHFILCRMFKWKNLNDNAILFPCNKCKFGFDPSRLMFCINPYHYDKHETSWVNTNTFERRTQVVSIERVPPDCYYDDNDNEGEDNDEDYDVDVTYFADDESSSRRDGIRNPRSVIRLKLKYLAAIRMRPKLETRVNNVSSVLENSNSSDHEDSDNDVDVIQTQ